MDQSPTLYALELMRVELDSAESVIMSLALTVEARDPNTEGHCQRLSRLASTIGSRIGLSADEYSPS